MKLMKLMACAALAAACAVGISGCGSKDYSKPKVAEGAIAAIMVRPAEDTSLAQLCKQYGLGLSDLMKKIPDATFQEVAKELELEKATHKWIAVTIQDVSAEKVEKGEPDFAVAIATTVDLDKAIAVAEKKFKDEKKDDEVKKTTVADVPAYEFVSKKKTDGFAANLDKKLILIANTQAGLEKQIALYRDGKGASADFSSFGLSANDILRIKAMKVGENLKKALGENVAMLQMVNGVIPDGDKIVLGLASAEIGIGASSDGKNAVLDISLDTASDADANKLRTAVKERLVAITEHLKAAAEKSAEAKAQYETAQSVKVEGEGKVAKLSAAAPAEPILKLVSEKIK